MTRLDSTLLFFLLSLPLSRSYFPTIIIDNNTKLHIHTNHTHTLHTDKDIQKEVTKITKQKQKFERMVVTKEEALELFADNPFKIKILSTKVQDNTRTTVYRCGDLIDLCRGPHVTHTGKVKAFAPAKHSAAYWLGDAAHDSLQRLYGISFPDKKQLKVWQEMMEKVRYHVCCSCVTIAIFFISIGDRQEDTKRGMDYGTYHLEYNVMTHNTS